MKSKALDKKQEMVDGVIYQYSSDWIHHLETEEHWRLYWQQAKLLQKMITPDDEVLEIGVGSGFLANYLRAQKINVKTLDIDPNKKPDIIANIVAVDWSQLKFDHILAFEVFEHIPFEKFERMLPSILAGCAKSISISVPINEHVLFCCDFRIPVIGRRRINLTIPKFRIDEENHFWEIGFGQTSLKKLVNLFEAQNFMLTKKFAIFSRQYLQFEK